MTVEAQTTQIRRVNPEKLCSLVSEGEVHVGDTFEVIEGCPEFPAITREIVFYVEDNSRFADTMIYMINEIPVGERIPEQRYFGSPVYSEFQGEFNRGTREHHDLLNQVKGED